MRKLYALMVCMLFASCSEKVYNNAPVLSITEESGKLVDTLFTCDMQEIKLETNHECAISAIEKIILHDSIYYIKDIRQDKVFMFGEDGHHIRTIKDIGRGHGEYINLIDVAIDRHAGELLLLVSPNGIMHYTVDGKFKYRQNLDRPYTDISCDKNHYYLRCETYANKNQVGHSVTVMDKKDGHVSDQLKLDAEHAPFCSFGPRMYDCGDRRFFTRFFDDTVYELADGGVTPAYSIGFGKYSFSTDMLDGRIDCDKLFGKARKSKSVYAVSKLKAGKRFMLFSSNLFDIFVYDVLEGRGIHSFANPWCSDMNLQWEYHPLEGTTDKICGVVRSSVFSSMKKIIKENLSLRDRFSEEAIRVADRFNDGDNPLILIYTLK